MCKKLSDDELQEWLKKQMEKENESLENHFFSGIFEKKEEITDEELDLLYEQALERLKMQDVLQKENAEKEYPDKGKRKKRIFFKEDSVFGYRKLAKVAGVVIVGALAVFVASMSIEANRNYFIDSVKYLTGNDTKILIDNDASNDKPSLDEEQARDEIEKEMGVEVPEFLYRPETFEFYKYEMNRESGTVGLQYWYEKNIVSLYISKSVDNIQSNNLSIVEAGSEMIYIKKEEIPVNLSKIQEKGDSMPNYLAEWEREGCYYQLSGKMPEEIFKKIIKEMIF